MTRTVKYFVIFFLFANFLFLLSNMPLIIRYNHAPKGTYYPLYHYANTYDYNVYLSAINQGMHGAWLFKDAYTQEKTNPSLFYFYYILAGKLFTFFPIDTPYIYHIVRIFSVEIFFIGLFLLSTHILGLKKGAVAAGISLIVTNAPPFLFNQPGALTTFTPWWNSFEAFKRLDYMPHYLLGYGLLCFSVLFYFMYSEQNNKKYLIVCTILAALNGMLFPPSALILLIALPIGIVLPSVKRFIKTKKMSLPILELRTYVFFAVPILISVLLIWRENYNGFPWNVWNTWEIAKWNKDEPLFNRSLFFMYGLLPYLALPGAITAIKKCTTKSLFLILWGYFPYLFMPFIDTLIPLSKFRLVSTATFVPLSILLTMTFTEIKFFRDHKKTASSAFLVFVLSCLYVSIPQFLGDVQASFHPQMYANIFIPKNHKSTIDYINNFVSKNSVILSNETTGNLLPAYTQTVSFFGHTVHTKDFYTKQGVVWMMLAQKYSEIEAKKTMHDYGISYIFYGSDEQYISNSPTLNYSFLNPVYSNSGVILYEIHK